jgi:glycosyltransferase involved in cell wall biosynthesis
MTPRIVIMVNNIHELGGAQRVSHTLAQGLALRGYRVELVGLVPKNDVHQYYEHPAYESHVLLDQPRSAEHKEAQQAHIESRLAALLQAGEPGIVITAHVWAMEHLTRVPHPGWRVIGQYHSSFDAARDSRDLARLEATYGDVDWFTTLCTSDTRAFTAAGFNNCITMPNPIDPWPSESASLANQIVTVLGRMSWEKAPDIALDAWAMIEDEFPEWSLQFVGHGPMSADIAARDVPRVRILPSTHRPLELLLESGLFLLPSLVEGLPMSLGEAMACGLPVVATDCSPGVRSLITHEHSGLLAGPGDHTALARQLRRALSDQTLRHSMAKEARISAARLAPGVILDRWEWLIAQTNR